MVKTLVTTASSTNSNLYVIITGVVILTNIKKQSEHLTNEFKFLKEIPSNVLDRKRKNLILF